MSSAILLALLGLSSSVDALTSFSGSPGRLAIADVVLPPAEHVQILTDRVQRSSRKSAIMRQIRNDMSGSTDFTVELAGTGSDGEYVTDITVGGQFFKVIVDTGSADTWFPVVGFQCYDLSSQPQTNAECGFGSPGFNPATSSTFEEYPDTNFNISYASGEFLTGTVGYDTVTVGDLSVTHQVIGVVDAAAWIGDNVNSGLLGLAYPNLTDVYPGTDPNVDTYDNYLPYNPFFFTAIEQSAVSEPYFSIALNRGSIAAQENSSYDAHLGYLAFGGIAPVAVTSTSVTVPVQGYTTHSGASAYFFYNLDIDAYVFTGCDALVTSGTAILDTGTTLNYLPNTTAIAFNALFDPPATLNATDGYYYVNCNVTAPDFSAIIGGVTFSVDTRDQIVPVGLDANGVELCISGTQDGDALGLAGLYILGDVFLHNVVATFSVSSTVPSDNSVTLTEREAY